MFDSPARRSGLIFGVWALLGLAVAAANMLYLRGVRDFEVNASFERAAAAAHLVEQALLRSADAVSSVLSFAQTRVELTRDGDHDAAAAALDQRLREIIDQRRSGIRGIAAVDLDGVVTWSPREELVGMVVTERERFAAMATAGTPTVVVSPPFVSRMSGEWLVTATRSLHDAEGRVTGFVTVGFDPMQLNRLLTVVARRPGRSLVIRQIGDGRVRGASHEAEARMAGPPEPDHPTVQAARSAASGRLRYVSSWSERPVLTAFRTVRSRNMVVYAAFDEAEAMALYRRVQAPVIAGAVFYIVGSLLLAACWDFNIRLRSRLHAQAKLDPLTGLLNRCALEERLGELGNGDFACLLFSIDRLSVVNDRFGHARGDQVLCNVARLLLSGMGECDLVCRWGGNELLLLQPGDRAAALARAEGLRIAVERLHDGVLGITASVGVACFPGDGTDPETVLKLAREALSRAKRSGRNQVAMVAALEDA